MERPVRGQLLQTHAWRSVLHPWQNGVQCRVAQAQRVTNNLHIPAAAHLSGERGPLEVGGHSTGSIGQRRHTWLLVVCCCHSLLATADAAAAQKLRLDEAGSQLEQRLISLHPAAPAMLHQLSQQRKATCRAGCRRRHLLCCRLCCWACLSSHSGLCCGCLAGDLAALLAPLAAGGWCRRLPRLVRPGHGGQLLLPLLRRNQVLQPAVHLSQQQLPELATLAAPQVLRQLLDADRQGGGHARLDRLLPQLPARLALRSSHLEGWHVDITTTVTTSEPQPATAMLPKQLEPHMMECNKTVLASPLPT